MIPNEFKYLLQSLVYASRRNQDCAIKEILTSIRNVCQEDLQDVFGLLSSTSDMKLQVKLFSILAAHLLSNDNNNEVIVTYRPLYDRIQDVLDSGISHGTTTTLNFVTALLSVYSDDESPSPRKKSLALFARNMIRISGCLATMSNMFTSCMMDTWIALCRCLAEACQGSEINQNYCTHLVPTCVKKCQQVNIEVCSLLHSLLHNNDRNIQIFLDNDGLTIFTRELLQHDSCMQLLNNILNRSTQTVTLLSVTHVPKLLRDILHAHGSHPKVAQWAKIVLHHFDSRLRAQNPEYNMKSTEELMTKNSIFLDQHNVDSFQSGKFSLGRRNVRSRKYSPDETAKLFQNVVKEVISWNAQSKPGFKKPSPLEHHEMRFNCKSNDNYTPSTKQWIPRKDEIKVKDNIVHGNVNLSKDMSFSFLMRQDFQNPSKNGDRIHYMNKQTKKNAESQTDAVEMFTNTDATGLEYREINNTHETDQASITFAPVHASTPRNKICSCNKSTLSKTSRISRSKAPNSYKRKKLGIQKPKKREEVNTMQETKNRSLSSRLFSAINDSCTTLVKSVKSIFKPKKNFQSKDRETKFSNNSFTKYMRRRDALLEDKCTKTETDSHDISTEKSYVNSCRTCDDTMILKQKLANDEYLKQTLKKLKLGVNLYGCDFKKICMALWPHEKYMTPNVLYNLYRKLIVKNMDF